MSFGCGGSCALFTMASTFRLALSSYCCWCIHIISGFWKRTSPSLNASSDYESTPLLNCLCSAAFDSLAPEAGRFVFIFLLVGREPGRPGC